MSYVKVGYASKLSEEDVKDIKKRLKNGEKQVDIARLYNVHQSQVSRINTGNTWAVKVRK